MNRANSNRIIRTKAGHSKMWTGPDALIGATLEYKQGYKDEDGESSSFLYLCKGPLRATPTERQVDLFMNKPWRWDIKYYAKYADGRIELVEIDVSTAIAMTELDKGLRDDYLAFKLENTEAESYGFKIILKGR